MPATTRTATSPPKQARGFALFRVLRYDAVRSRNVYLRGCLDSVIQACFFSTSVVRCSRCRGTTRYIYSQVNIFIEAGTWLWSIPSQKVAEGTGMVRSAAGARSRLGE